MSIKAPRNTVRHSPFRAYKRPYGFSSLLFLLTTITTIPIHADGEISELITSSVTATPQTIVVDGVNYQWGQGNNLQLDGFFNGNDEYVPNLKASSVSVLRRDIPGVAIGELCGIFAERQGNTGNNLNPDFPAQTDSAGICDMSAMLTSSIINRGTLDTFTNTGLNPNNIERIDYLFDGGITAPSDPAKLSSAGHIIGEKQGNNIVQMAAILAKDDLGNPEQYGPLVSVNTIGGCISGGICYGRTSIIHDNAFFKSHSLEPLRDMQSIARVTESVAFAFLSMETLGIPAGGTYYGVSVFPHDVNASTNSLTDISSFPDDTQEPASRPNDSADIYGGSAFLYTIPSGITGRVFCQADDGGTEPAASQPISLFRDTVEDGVLDPLQDELIAELPGTTQEGQYSFPGLENGSYFVAVSDQADDVTASLAVVINSSPVDDADIVLDEPCNGGGPTAVDDEPEPLTNTEPVLIEVLVNDRNSEDEIDAEDLEIISVSDPIDDSDLIRADLEIQDRAVAYTVNQATIDLLATALRIEDKFTYTVRDSTGGTSTATVTVTIVGPPPPCLAETLPTECLFVATEVDGIGRIPPFVCILLLTVAVLRRNALFVNAMEDQS